MQQTKLKGVAEIRGLCERCYGRVWASEVAGAAEVTWPYAIRVGRLSQRALEQDYVGISSQADEIAAWATTRGLLCVTEPRKVGRMAYPILSHVLVPSLDLLAHAIGQDDHLARYRRWSSILREQFAQTETKSIRDVLVSLNRTNATEVDFELACAAAMWFMCHDASGYTPREVPLEGFHAKWLDAPGHRQMVCALAGLDDLVLRERPRLVRFVYLDPAYLATGARAYDSWLEGDSSLPAYAPRMVVICENRDSALWFPPLESAIAVLGDGMAGTATLARIDWIAHASRLLYWGDIDIHGFKILAAYRKQGLAMQSILMDQVTYDAYRRFGTSVDARGRQLQPQPNAGPLEGLSVEENALYLHLCSSDCKGPRRIEQERIPLDVALAACRR